MKRIILFLSSLVIILTGCGQSGNLYMPTPTTNKQHKNDTYLINGKKSASTTNQNTEKKSDNDNTRVVSPDNNTNSNSEPMGLEGVSTPSLNGHSGTTTR